MSTLYEHLEAYYASDTTRGLLQSARSLLSARSVPEKNKTRPRFQLTNLYIIPFYIYVWTLAAFQRIRTAITGRPSKHSPGMWEDYLHWGLREDLGHFTNETTGYYRERPEQATPVDDLSAWVMAVIQFVWNYQELLGNIWDEWTLLRLAMEAAQRANLENEEIFRRLDRQWELKRRYDTPLNGTYADIRRDDFTEFYTHALEALPDQFQAEIYRNYMMLASKNREAFKQQMSILANIEPGRYLDKKRPIPLWDVSIGLVVGGHYHLISLIARHPGGAPIVYSQDGSTWALELRDGQAFDRHGALLRLDGDQLFRVDNNDRVGWLDMAPIEQIKWQIRQILEETAPGKSHYDPTSVDLLLAETPRNVQHRLRALLPVQTQQALHNLIKAPVIINWDEQASDQSLADIRRTHRGIGDHPMTIIRTDNSVVFDLSHLFFDGTWSLAVAEVLTNVAVEWCRRTVDITPIVAQKSKPLRLESSAAFSKSARARRQPPEISVETTIYDIALIGDLRKLLANTGTYLTVNDLLVTARVFHAAHYKPSTAVQQKIDEFNQQARSRQEKHAARAVSKSLERGRATNPALAIPIDASLADPQARLHTVVFRNLLDNLVWIWDDAWEAYQAYRRIEPPDTPEGIAALDNFGRKQALLIGILRTLGWLLSANKAVGRRGNSLTVAMSELMVGLPLWVRHLLNLLPENFAILSEIIKGDETYSNVGRVARGSSLSRFITVKDDGNAKELAWGILTDDQGRMIVSMRDFRSHVMLLNKVGHIDLAQSLAQDYVVAYTNDLIGLVARLAAMLQVDMSPTMK